MTTKSITHNGLTITSSPMWYPDENAFGALGTISGIDTGNGGGQTETTQTAIGYYSNENSAHDAFFEWAKKYIKEHHPS